MKNLLLSLLIALSFISVNAQRYAANLDMTVIKNYKKIEKSYEIYSIKKGSTYHVDSIYQITTPIPNENNANLSFYMNTPDVMLEVNKDIVKHIKFDPPRHPFFLECQSYNNRIAPFDTERLTI